MNDIAGNLAKAVLIIAVMIVVFQQLWVTFGGKPETVGHIRADIERHREAKRQYVEQARESQLDRLRDPDPHFVTPSINAFFLPPGAKVGADGTRAKPAALVRTASYALPADGAARAKALGISERNYAAIAAASAKYKVPAGLLYGIKISESGYREDHPGGDCLAYEQYAIRDKWLGGNPRYNRKVDGAYYTNGEANKRALQIIATNIGRDWTTIVGSCGHSTMTKRDRDFGGCIGPTQITPVEWINDPEFRDKDPFDIYWATMWVAKRFSTGYAKWSSKGLDHDEARAKSTLQYPGNPDGWYAWNYYVNKAMPKWRKWNEVHGVDAPGAQLASR